MHRFDTFLMFSTTLRLRIIDFTVSAHVGTYVPISGQTRDISGQTRDISGQIRDISGQTRDICPDIGTNSGHYVPISGHENGIALPTFFNSKSFLMKSGVYFFEIQIKCLRGVIFFEILANSWIFCKPGSFFPKS